jgi:hypothetical protein
MNILNYKKLKLKKYSYSADVNMNYAGWDVLSTIDDVTGNRSRDIVKSYAKAADMENKEFCYRRGIGAWGLPFLVIYIKRDKQ